MRNILKAAAVAGSAATLALAAASAAGASTLGGSPSPKGTPPPVVRHHHHPKPRTHQFCFESLLTETDSLSGHQINPLGEQGGKPAPMPTQTIVNGGNQGQGGQGGQPKAKGDDEVVVVQLVKVCETVTRGGRVIAVTATDESSPFAWVAQGGDHGQAPAGVPGQIRGLLKS